MHTGLVMSGEGITVEGWFYLDEYPAEGTLFAPLIMKPASYAIVLTDRPKLGIARLVDPGPYVQLKYYDYGSHVFDGALFCDTFAGRSVLALPDKTPIPTAEWMHVAFELRDEGDGAMLSYFLNGMRLGKLGESWVGESDAPFFIGGVPAWSPCLDLPPRSWPGKVDAVRVSRGVRYDTDVFVPERELRVDKDTIALWNFDGPAATYEDQAGNGHTLSPTGSLSVSARGKLATAWAVLRTP